ncbi:hypothetical protein B0T20DRAFT_497805 [Sordaria brevicollis]|uniref:Uncharacterized protein n=1 Tax=Sordaria brevicollis TaxID=83679 RepID=A0AAE0PGF9_SORBR|nr:hypothetical protein B0T20DRAFT_497805 [Sordaria brevicollis]
MDKLPQEVIDKIAGHLLHTSRVVGNIKATPIMFTSSSVVAPPSGRRTGSRIKASQYATISRSWQRAIEALTFYRLELNTKDEVRYAAECLKGEHREHRRSRVFQIKVDITVGVAPGTVWGEVTEEERDREIVDGLRGVVEFVNSTWPIAGVVLRPLDLLITINITITTPPPSTNTNPATPADTQLPPTLQNLTPCPAITSLAINYTLTQLLPPPEEEFIDGPRNRTGYTSFFWRPGLHIRAAAEIAQIGATMVRPGWLIEIGGEGLFPTLYSEEGEFFLWRAVEKGDEYEVEMEGRRMAMERWHRRREDRWRTRWREVNLSWGAAVMAGGLYW